MERSDSVFVCVCVCKPKYRDMPVSENQKTILSIGTEMKFVIQRLCLEKVLLTRVCVCVCVGVCVCGGDDECGCARVSDDMEMFGECVPSRFCFLVCVCVCVCGCVCVSV